MGLHDWIIPKTKMIPVHKLFVKHFQNVKFYPRADNFTHALHVMYVTNIMSGHQFANHSSYPGLSIYQGQWLVLGKSLGCLGCKPNTTLLFAMYVYNIILISYHSMGFILEEERYSCCQLPGESKLCKFWPQQEVNTAAFFDLPLLLLLFSYASSSTLHPRQSVSRWVIVSN